ncbi:MAG: hypothetical protein CMG57_09770 [Candidatus Marinimicrobia bacterium]|nr:hypothetical protein [Candidatus Neomarinimicrobiota bacterium]|tara:strand:+ start:17675 stop:19441 length:1767 start_codon:yes stop_codon:yes gene_type:complete
MCGILAVYSKNGQLPIDRCNSALEKLDKRGPDFKFSNIYYDGALFFGQTVLSITGNPNDYITSYHKSSNNRYDLVLNGEIYNYKDLYNKFLKINKINNNTNSDTETLVNLHQILPLVEVYKNIRGMFAYILFDHVSKSLIIGRDLIGEKILYYFENDNFFIVCSEIGPILKIVPTIKVNKELLKEYFFTRHLLSPIETSFEGIRLVKPGFLKKYNLVSKRFTTIYSTKPADLIDQNIIEENKRKTFDQLLLELEEVFINTSKQLSPSIDYYSVFSGGIDSSLVSYYMQRTNPPTEFISLQFPGKDSTNLLLSKFEKKLKRKINSIEVDKKIFLSHFPECYEAACAPLATHSFVSQAIMTAHLKNKNIKILIGGDGADELFGGYEYYKNFNKEINYFPKVNPSVYSGFVPSKISFYNWVPSNLKEKINKEWLNISKYYSFEKNIHERLLQSVLYSDTVIQLESVGIRSSDTMSMVNSVESRSFFLSYDMIKFALNLPSKYKINNDINNPLMSTKPLLKALYANIFGEKLIFKKQGFSGYPNEAANMIVDNKFPFLNKILDIKIPFNVDRSLEWKMMNVEIFLNNYRDHL